MPRARRRVRARRRHARSPALAHDDGCCSHVTLTIQLLGSQRHASHKHSDAQCVSRLLAPHPRGIGMAHPCAGPIHVFSFAVTTGNALSKQSASHAACQRRKMAIQRGCQFAGRGSHDAHACTTLIALRTHRVPAYHRRRRPWTLTGNVPLPCHRHDRPGPMCESRVRSDGCLESAVSIQGGRSTTLASPRR